MPQNILLNAKQVLEINLSSQQILTTLNDLLNIAAEPLFDHCSLFRQLLLQLLLQTQADHRRKISIHNKETTAGLLIAALIQQNYQAVILCEIDRSSLFGIVDHIYTKLQEAITIEHKLLKYNDVKLWSRLQKIAQYVGCDINLLTPLARWCSVYYKDYLKFRSQIIGKYVKYAWSEANAAKANTDLTVDIKDLNENYLLAIGKAIDKCDSKKGTLTSYIMQWMLSARSSPDFDHQVGIAFPIPANIRKKRQASGVLLNNISQEIGPDQHEIIDEVEQDKMAETLGRDKKLLSLLRQLPGAKIVFMTLNLPIELTTEEINRFRTA